MEVDNEEGVVGLDLLAAFVLLALDAAIATREFGPKAFRDVGDVPARVAADS